MAKCNHAIDTATMQLKMNEGGWVGTCKHCGAKVILRRVVATGKHPYVKPKVGGTK